jgi:Zn-dependent peptidase ImmA (M78 family)/transcriptional regulator with XRE-family HTH domain
MFAERLHRARKAAGKSMDALGKDVGLSANAIKKYEHGQIMPTSGNLLKLAKALDVRTEYFFRPNTVELGEVEYRKRSNAPKKLISKINEDVLEQAERWLELLNLYPESIPPVPQFDLPEKLLEEVTTFDEVEMVAEQVRNAWNLGLNPIPDMVDTMESLGIMIISTEVEQSEKFDGLAGAIDKTPVIVVSAKKPGDRQRFTLSHELGHLVLKKRLRGLEEEKACNRFAAAFLLPRESLVQHLGTKRHAIEPQELYMLKHEFGISMMAILMRLGDCRVITENQKKNYQIKMGKAGWRKEEPGDPYPKESTYLYKQLVYRALGEEYIGESKAAELLGVSLSAFHTERRFGIVDETTNQ